MSRHVTPHQCLSSLVQKISDGGRSEFLDQEASMGNERDSPQGDCAIVAAVYATFQQPTGQSYREARSRLLSGIHPQVFNDREPGESVTRFTLRRIKQRFSLPNMEPMQATPRSATLSYLKHFGYQRIFPNAKQQWHCICEPSCSYHVDMVMLSGGGHAICVQQGIAYSTMPFDPEHVQVAIVLGLGTEETAYFSALGRYYRDHEAWRDRMIESRDWCGDWSSEPKLDDYLQK